MKDLNAVTYVVVVRLVCDIQGESRQPVVDPGESESGGESVSSDPPCWRGKRTTAVSCSLPSDVFDGGLWSNELQCYVYTGSTDPTEGGYEHVWAGRTEGVVLWCGWAYDYCTITPDGGVISDECFLMAWWQDRVPWRDGPSPEELARTIVTSMELRAGDIGLAPPSYTVRPGSQFIVGIPVWLWVDDPGEATTGPMTRSQSTAGIEVSATATLDRIVYDMGDGGTVVWTGMGQSGTIPVDVTGSVPVRVGEIQVLLVR